MMNDHSEHEAMIEHIWRTYLTTGEFEKERRQRHFFRMLPGNPRCKNCYAPFKGFGGAFVKIVYSKQPSTFNPSLCNVCEVFARQYQGGAEIELSLLFADVRGSTSLAEGMRASEYSQLINRFYKATTLVLVNHEALIDKITGDQVVGLFVPGFAGVQHASMAIAAAQEILHVTGHYGSETPWIPLGVGVHTGIAYVGAVGTSDGMVDITVLGDAANTAARLSSSAGSGEILVSDAAVTAAGFPSLDLEKRTLELKGKSDLFEAYVLRNSILNP